MGRDDHKTLPVQVSKKFTAIYCSNLIRISSCLKIFVVGNVISRANQFLLCLLSEPLHFAFQFVPRFNFHLTTNIYICSCEWKESWQLLQTHRFLKLLLLVQEGRSNLELQTTTKGRYIVNRTRRSRRQWEYSWCSLQWDVGWTDKSRHEDMYKIMWEKPMVPSKIVYWDSKHEILWNLCGVICDAFVAYSVKPLWSG